MRVIHSIDYRTPMTHDTLWPSVFLAGPTPRDPSVASWRPEAIKLFESMGHRGWIFVPEPAAGLDAWNWSGKEQMDWERHYLTQASAVLFWIPRSEDKLPGLTTNLEFGMWICRDPHKVVFGAPEGAWKMESLEYYGKVNGIVRHATLRDTVAATIVLLEKQGRLRGFLDQVGRE